MTEGATNRFRQTGIGETIAGWCALVAMILFFFALGPALHFLPPLAPSGTAEEFAQHYRDHAVGVRIGSVLMMTAASLILPVIGGMSAVMLRMEGKSIALSAAQLATGITSFLPLFMCSFFFAAVSFRPERSDDDMLVISDIAWFWLIMPTPSVLIQLILFAIAILGDNKANPVLPRWFGYYSIWVGILFFAGVFIPLFKHGPFAWNGLFAFWIPLAVFGTWLPMMAWQLIHLGKHISRGEQS